MSGRGQGRVGAEGQRRGRRRGRRQTPLCPDARARFARCVLTRILRLVLPCVSMRGRRPACNVCARRTPPGPTQGLAVRLAVASGSSAHGTRTPARALGLVRVCERPREAPGAARPSCPALRARPARRATARGRPARPGPARRCTVVTAIATHTGERGRCACRSDRCGERTGVKASIFDVATSGGGRRVRDPARPEASTPGATPEGRAGRGRTGTAQPQGPPGLCSPLQSPGVQGRRLLPPPPPHAPPTRGPTGPWGGSELPLPPWPALPRRREGRGRKRPCGPLRPAPRGGRATAELPGLT